MKKYPLILYFSLTFLICWGMGALYFLAGDALTQIFGEVSHRHPLFMLAVYAPFLSALITTAAVSGKKGIAGLFRRLVHWRVGAGWYLTITAFFAFMFCTIRVVTWLSGSPVPEITFTWQQAPILLLSLLITDPGPIGEEAGWRGFALPRIQRRLSPVAAGLALGAVWGVWHLPAFFVSGLGHSIPELASFFIQIVPLSLLMTLVYNATGGSILVAIIIHWLGNAGGAMNFFYFNNSSNIICGIFYLSASFLLFTCGRAGLIGSEPVTDYQESPFLK